MERNRAWSLLASPPACPSDLLAHLQSARCLGDALQHSKQLSSDLGCSVTLATCKGTGRQLVVKTYSKHCADLQQVMTEVSIHAALSSLCPPSPYISPLLVALQDSRQVHLVLEHAEGGDLRAHMQGMSERDVRDFVARPLLAALALLQQQGVVHRDMKPENVLVHGSRVLLADFGLAVRTVADPPNTGPSSGQEASGCCGANSGFTAGPAWSAAGTPAYTAPEVLLALFHSRPICDAVGPHNDVWALAITLLEALPGGGHPFAQGSRAVAAHSGNVMAAVAQCKGVDLPKHLRPELKDFLSQALQPDPALRPSARQLLQHPWMSCRLRTQAGNGTSAGGSSAPILRPQAAGNVGPLGSVPLRAMSACGLCDPASSDFCCSPATSAGTSPVRGVGSGAPRGAGVRSLSAELGSGGEGSSWASPTRAVTGDSSGEAGPTGGEGQGGGGTRSLGAHSGGHGRKPAVGGGLLHQEQTPPAAGAVPALPMAATAFGGLPSAAPLQHACDARDPDLGCATHMSRAYSAFEMATSWED